jgi:hypothetical protein
MSVSGSLLRPRYADERVKLELMHAASGSRDGSFAAESAHRGTCAMPSGAGAIRTRASVIDGEGASVAFAAMRAGRRRGGVRLPVAGRMGRNPPAGDDFLLG